MARCGYHTIEGEKHFIPGCEGSAFGGENYCTCYKPIAKGKKATQTIENIEAECTRLRAINEALNKKINKVQQENIKLLREGLPLTLRRKIEGDKVSLYLFLKRLIQ